MNDAEKYKKQVHSAFIPVVCLAFKNVGVMHSHAAVLVPRSYSPHRSILALLCMYEHAAYVRPSALVRLITYMQYMNARA